MVLPPIFINLQRCLTNDVAEMRTRYPQFLSLSGRKRALRFKFAFSTPSVDNKNALNVAQYAGSHNIY